MSYSVLDQESIARGHMAYYLQWVDEALAEAGDAFTAAGITSTSQLSADAQALRKQAIAANGQAEALFADFDFVDATFAAQEAWRAAAALRDLALGLEAGTSELEKGTALEGDASACPSADEPAAEEEAAEDEPAEDEPADERGRERGRGHDHDHGRGGDHHDHDDDRDDHEGRGDDHDRGRRRR
jgi:hypothetical protein